MQGRERTANIFNQTLYYLMALGTFLLGTVIDLIVLLLFDTYTPAFGLCVMFYHFYLVFTQKFTRFTPPKDSIHCLVNEDELGVIYEMFAEVAPKGSNLKVFRSIGLENEAEVNITRSESSLYIEEDTFLRCNQDSDTRSYAFSQIIFGTYSAQVVRTPIMKISWMSKLSNAVDSMNGQMQEENRRTTNNMAKAAILGGIVGGGPGAMVGGSAVGVAKTTERSPAILILSVFLVFMLYVLALFIVIVVPYFLIYLRLKNKVEKIGKDLLGASEAESKLGWKRGESLFEKNDVFKIDPNSDFYTADQGWKPLYEF